MSLACALQGRANGPEASHGAVYLGVNCVLIFVCAHSIALDADVGRDRFDALFYLTTFHGRTVSEFDQSVSRPSTFLEIRLSFGFRGFFSIFI